MAAEDTCKGDAKSVDCGYSGILSEECYNRGCCWDHQYGGPYCFYQGL